MEGELRDQRDLCLQFLYILSCLMLKVRCAHNRGFLLILWVASSLCGLENKGKVLGKGAIEPLHRLLSQYEYSGV